MFSYKVLTTGPFQNKSHKNQQQPQPHGAWMCVCVKELMGESPFRLLGCDPEDPDVDGRVVPDPGQWLSRVSLWFQLIHQLHGGGIGSHLEGPKAACLQLQSDVDGAVNGQAQAVDVNLSACILPSTASVQQLLAAR